MFYECCQNFEPVPGRCSQHGVHQMLNLNQGNSIVCIGLNRSNSHKPSHKLGIDPVILRVRAHESYIADLKRIIDCCHKPISVALDVKHDAVLAKKAGIGICTFDVCRGLPNRCLNIAIPGPETLFYIRMALPEFPQNPPGYNPHE
jgi:hypothetical protein